MKVCLIITTWRGAIGATHFYGRLCEYDAEWNADNVDLRVMQPLTEVQAGTLNVIDDTVGKSYAYEAGEPTERFDNEETVRKVAIEMAREKWGEDVEIYVGNPARALEDMERLI